MNYRDSHCPDLPPQNLTLTLTLTLITLTPALHKLTLTLIYMSTRNAAKIPNTRQNHQRGSDEICQTEDIPFLQYVRPAHCYRQHE